MPRVNIYIRNDNQDRWEAITDKSAWVNAMLEASAPNKVVLDKGLEGPYPATDLFKEESVGRDDRQPNGKKLALLSKIQIEKDMERLEAQECKGTHYMTREDCGKPGCPWR